MLRYYFLLLLCLSPALVQAQPDTVKVGIFVTNLYDLSLTQNEFKGTFWMWFVYKDNAICEGDTMRMLNQVELPNTKDFRFNSKDMEVKGGLYWETQQCWATFVQRWNVDHYPFDRQVLRIHLEDAEKDTSALIYIADKKNTVVDKALQLNGWYIDSVSIDRIDHVYNSNYGDPTMADGESVYPGVVMEIHLSRDAAGIFFKFFALAFLSFIISYLLLFVNPRLIDARLALAVGAIFGAVGNKYIVDSSLPENASLTLSDQVHIVVFGCIFIGILLSVIDVLLIDRHPRWVRRIDRISMWALPFVFTTLITIIVMIARNARV